MRWQTLVGLGAVALAVAGYLLFVEPHGPSTDERRDVAHRVLPAFAREQVQAIRIVRPSQPVLELQRQGRRWRIIAPLGARADAAAVEQLLAQVEYLEYLRLPPQQRRRALGLAPPRVSLELRGLGRAVKLDLGRLDSSGRGLYLACGEKIFVVERSLSDALDHGIDELRDRALVPIPAPTLTRVVIERHGRELELRDSGRHWWLRSREGATVEGPLRVAPAVAQRLSSTLAELRATRFLGGEVADPSSLSRIVVEGRGERVELFLGGACPARVGERLLVEHDEGAWRGCCVEAAKLELLEASEAALLDPALLDASEPTFKAIGLRDPDGREVRLRRADGAWQLPGAVAADEQAVHELIERLSQYRGVVDPTGDTRVDGIRLTLAREGESTSEEIRFGAPLRGRVPVQRANEAAVLWVREDVLAVVEVAPLRYRSRQLFSFAPSVVGRLEVARGGTIRRIVREAGRWHVGEPRGPVIDERRVAGVLQQLARLRAVRYVTSPLSETPSSRITIALALDELSARGAAAEEKIVLELWERASSPGCYGRFEGRGEMPGFILDRGACEQLAAAW